MSVNVDAGHRQRIRRKVSSRPPSRPGRPWPPARPGCRCRCTGPARAWVARSASSRCRRHQQLGNQASAARWRARPRKTARPATRLRASGRRRAGGCDSCSNKSSYLLLFHAGYRPICYRFGARRICGGVRVAAAARVATAPARRLRQRRCGAVAKRHPGVSELRRQPLRSVPARVMRLVPAQLRFSSTRR